MSKSQKEKQPEKKNFTKLIFWFWGLFVGGCLFVTGFFYALAMGWIWELPSFEELENPKSNLATEIITSDQKILGKYYSENRTNIEYGHIPKYLVDGLVTTEDERFYNHSGIDLKGLIRAVFYLGQNGGASTITQQLAKQLYHEPAITLLQRLKQKLIEWVIAAQLERQYTKEEIITMYLNKFDFINHAVGVESASNVYFGMHADSLKIHQAALLVGMCNNPSYYNPLRFEERAKTRRNIVFGQMKRNGIISEQEKDSLQQLPLDLNFTSADHKDGVAPYFREILRSELSKLFSEKDKDGNYVLAKANGDRYDIYRDGLKVYTTIDMRMQKYAEWAVQKHIGGELQPTFDRLNKNKRNAPFSNSITDKQAQSILNRAKKRSPRYLVLTGRQCANCGRRGSYVSKEVVDGKPMWVCSASDCHHQSPVVHKDSIDALFDTPVDMKVFTWKGEVDTTMSPMDSIRYYKKFLQSGLMSMDPKTGEIKAWVGGINYKYFNYDHVKQGKRQVGSTFKPFVYALAIEAGYSPCYEVPNILYTFKKGEWGLLKDWTPKNSDGEYGYNVTLKYGLGNSMNTITAWVMKQFGPPAVIEYARRMGITSKLDTVPSLVLGVADISLYEMVGANATFANKGIWQEPIFITRIEDKNGTVIKEFRPKTNEAMSEENAYVMLSLMKGVVDGVRGKHDGKKIGTGIRLRYDSDKREYDGIKYPIAGKTGTTQNNSDGWFMGITPDLVTGVWVGADDRSVHFSRTYYGQGANTALPIWGYYMKKVYADPSIKISTGDFEAPLEPLSVELDCDKYSSSGGFDDGGGNVPIFDQ
tara:strand:+ start:13544 stop:15988 length:2445 start_codon:yes stop_codon:yes gene_type:complete